MLTLGVNGALKRSKSVAHENDDFDSKYEEGFFDCKKNQTLLVDLGWIERHDNSKLELVFSVAITNKPIGMKCSRPKMYSDAA